jgi:hypothetical protein
MLLNPTPNISVKRTLTLGYKDFPICQAMGTHNLTAKLQVIQNLC